MVDHETDNHGVEIRFKVAEIERAYRDGELVEGDEVEVTMTAQPVVGEVFPGLVIKEVREASTSGTWRAKARRLVSRDPA